jgi:hypothetical protein
MKERAIFILTGIDEKTELSFMIDTFSIRITKITRDIEEIVGSLEIDEKTYLLVEGKSDQEGLLEIAQNIKNLLSLAVGRRIIFNKQLYYDDDSSIEFVSREMAAPINEGQEIIPNFNIGVYLQQVYHNYSKFSKEDKDQLFVCTEYLNQTKNGFVEDRILHTAIAWESLADYLKVSSELPAHLAELRSLLKTTIGAWRTENTQYDSNGELGSRILAAIDREKLLGKLIKLASKFNLDNDLIGINFLKLKELRDSVAHSGRMGITGTDAYYVMEPAIKGLQIILLTWLGYRGLIFFHREGWTTREPIEKFYRQDL